MDVIAGGIARGAEQQVVDVRERSTADRIGDALIRCIGRWGLAKTTIDDVAREAGLSRATVYRAFPGGKTTILIHAAQSEVADLVSLLAMQLAEIDDLEDCLVSALCTASTHLEQHEALTFMRAHEPVALEQVLGFDRIDAVYLAAAELVGPVLGRFLEESHAREVTVWLTRVVVSYLTTPSDLLDLTDESQVRAFVAGVVLPGIAART